MRWQLRCREDHGRLEFCHRVACKALVVEGIKLVAEAWRCEEVALNDLVHLVSGWVIAFDVYERQERGEVCGRDYEPVHISHCFLVQIWYNEDTVFDRGCGEESVDGGVC